MPIIEMDKCIIGTGNILNLNKKAGQKTAEELLDCLKATLADQQIDDGSTQINRSNDDLRAKINEHKREEIKVGAKLFLNSNSVAHVTAAIDHLLATLDTCLDNLILAYHPKSLSTNGSDTNGQNGHHNGNGNGIDADAPPSANKEGVLEWGVGNRNALEDLKQLWQVLESYTKDSRISQLGIADLDTESLKALYASSVVKPTIAQINLSACCVVPGSLQEFCNKKEIQLLTHSDPEELLPASSMAELELSSFQPLWTTRYQVHVRCRGVLTAKGFNVAVELKDLLAFKA